MFAPRGTEGMCSQTWLRQRQTGRGGSGRDCAARDEGGQYCGEAALLGTKGDNPAARPLHLVRRGVLPIPLPVQIAEHEEEGDEDDGLDGGDEGEVFRKVAVILLDGEDQDGDEEDGQDHGHRDIFGEFAHGFCILTRIIAKEHELFFYIPCLMMS